MLNGMMTPAASIPVSVLIHPDSAFYVLGAATVMITEPNEDIPWKETMQAIIRLRQTNRVVEKTVVKIIVTITVNAVLIINVTMIFANTTTMIETITIINVLTMTIVNMITIIVVTTMTPTPQGQL